MIDDGHIKIVALSVVHVDFEILRATALGMDT